MEYEDQNDQHDEHDQQDQHEEQPAEEGTQRQPPDLMVQAWEKAIGERDPLVALGATRALKAHLSTWEATLVQEAVADGATWGAIGESVGVSRQAAWDRFHHDVHELRQQLQSEVHELRKRYKDEARDLRRRYHQELGRRSRRSGRP